MITNQAVENLDEVIEELTERLQSGDDLDLMAWMRDYPEHEPRLRTLLPVIEQMIRLEHGRSVAPDPELHDEGALPTLGDYEVLEEIGRGGMGVVYRARQRSLDRIVALKVLPLASLADKQQLARFQNEARAAATLRHPHIVPVYSVGVERGIHYYTMQYIAGLTLAQIVDQRRLEARQRSLGDAIADTEIVTRQDNDAQAGPRTSPSDDYRMVALWGTEVARALSHAHQHGIVHRDIKPGNLLVDGNCDIWITDFGLARLEIATTITGTGGVVGTWQYMSPEQASGNNGLVDHRTDIYSLGVTLYEALTLQAAFAESSRGQLLQQIASQDPANPRSIDAAIPIDLETIVLKAMSKEPGDRYATAAELADDLQRYLDGAPVLARRASKVQRLRRMIRRHSDLVFVAAVAMLLLSLTVAVAAGMIWRANQTTQAALARQDAALQRATDRTRMVREAADEMYRNVALEGITDDPELTGTQRRFLENALAIYQQLAEESSREFSAQLETGHTLAHMGDVLSMSGSWKEALEAAEHAIRVFAPLLDSQPDNVDVLRPLGQLYHNYAIRLDRAGQTERAMEATREAAKTVERLAALEPDKLPHQDMLASIQLIQSGLLRSLGRLPEAESFARRAWESAVAAAGQYDEFNWDAWRTAFDAADSLARVLRDLGRVVESEQVCRQAISECQTLLIDYPSNVRLAGMLGQLQGTLGGKLLEQDRLPEAESTLRAALAATVRSLPRGDSPARLLQTELKDEASLDQSYDPAAFLSHAAEQVRLGEILHRQEKFDEAELILTEATFVLEQLTRRYPDTPHFQEELARGEWYLARVLRTQGKSGEAEQHFRKAAELYRRLVAGHPECRRSLSLVCCQLGNLLLDEGRQAEAQEAYQAGIEQAEKSLAWRPDQPDVEEDLEILRKNLSRVSEEELPAAETP